MWIKFFVLLILSTIIIIAMPYAQQSIQMLLNAHDWISELLTGVFAGAEVGNMLRGLIALLVIPFLVGLIPAIIYWLIRKSWMPYFMEIIWFIWLVQTGALLAIYNIGS